MFLLLLFVPLAFASIWPLPTSITDGATPAILDSQFKFFSNSTSTIVPHALARYAVIMFPHQVGTYFRNIRTRMNPDLFLHSINVDVGSNDENLVLGVDESYSLQVPTTGTASLKAATVWGALRGLETFAQLVQYSFDYFNYLVPNAPVTLYDSPRFPHRGILVDTARHYQPIPMLKQFIDSLSYAKFNVMHWHVVDSQSFPMQSVSFKNLWKGAYNGDARYVATDVREIVAYAKERGIRVLPELDFPGHAASWCTGYPDICPSSMCKEPLDPSSNTTWALLQGLLRDMSNKFDGMFTDEFVHLGGDEVDYACWDATPRIVAWLVKNKMTNDDAYRLFVSNGHDCVHDLGRTSINWEEVWNHFGKKLKPDSVIQVWLSKKTAKSVVEAGYRVLISNYDKWYLDYLDRTWQDFYLNDPIENISDPKQKALVIGGEACMWGETVDSSDWFNTVWPRAGAVAERLWSQTNPTDTKAALPRLAAFRCLLHQRGIGAAPVNNKEARKSPSGPGCCLDQ